MSVRVLRVTLMPAAPILLAATAAPVMMATLATEQLAIVSLDTMHILSLFMQRGTPVIKKIIKGAERIGEYEDKPNESAARNLNIFFSQILMSVLLETTRVTSMATVLTLTVAMSAVAILASLEMASTVPVSTHPARN